jgi:hypothetical protein
MSPMFLLGTTENKIEQEVLGRTNLPTLPT